LVQVQQGEQKVSSSWPLFLSMFCVYILWSEKLQRFYIGTTDSIENRLAEHNSSYYPDSFSVKGMPWNLFLKIDCENSHQAYEIEKHIKKMKSSFYIKNLKQYPDMINKLLKKY
jgi:putative endonuclease